MKQIIICMVLIIMVCMLFCLASCEKSGQPEADGSAPPESYAPIDPVEPGTMESFSYNYSDFFGPSSYWYSLRKQDDAIVVFVYETMLYPDYGEMETEVEASVLESLEKLIDKYELSRWDGFHGSDPEVCDGDGFSLNISFSNGNSISASGSNAIPDANYTPFTQELNTLLKPYTEKMLETERQKMIDRGINGNLDFIMAYFKQYGSAGNDEYSIFITKSDVREDNFDVSIRSVSGDFLPAGEYRYYCSVDDESLFFEQVQVLIEKYQLINWYNYDRTAEDYNNAEWFQIDFGFDDDFYLTACGTEHPENYEQFRGEFLTLLCEKLQQMDQAGIITNTAGQ